MDARGLRSLMIASLCGAGLSGCWFGDKRGDDPIVCTALAEPAVIVSVVAAATEANLAGDAVGEIHDVMDLDADYVDALSLYSADMGEVQELAAGHERAGTYDLRVRVAGYAEWSDPAVVVPQGDCGPETVSREAELAVNPVVAQDSGETEVDETASLVTILSCDPAPLGWEGRLENGVVVLERVESGDCATSTDYHEIRVWDPTDSGGTSPQYAAHRLFRLTDTVSTTTPNQDYVRESEWLAAGTIDFDAYDEAGIVAGRLEGVDGDGAAVELLFWVDLSASRRYR